LTGDKFSAGDVLLQVETDKAQMDVEAPDDGVLAKIILSDGSSAVKVGSRIAVLADPEDDLSSLTIPPEDTPSASASASSPSPETSTSSESEQSSPVLTPPASSYGSDDGSTPAHEISSKSRPLYPSVQVLLHIHGISASDIQPTGPGGRLLKGDVLAYIGDISKDAPKSIASQINKRSHLDLSSITPAPTEEPKPTKAEAAAPETAEPELFELSIPISLAPALKLQQRLEDTIGSAPSLRVLLARAIATANEDLPRRPTAPSQSELFDAVLGLPLRAKVADGTFVPTIATPPPAVAVLAKAKKQSVLDELIGAKTLPVGASSRDLAAVAELETGGAENTFSLVVDKADQKRAYVFLERMKTVLEAEPGRLVL
jgi:pyruvate/2-oxoglutarate dehydrogenase complex dihydrolipoamide acyltransferase (E2) component